jgi:hypothetical protein
LTFVKILCDNDDSNVVIVDDNDTPIRIEQLHEFYDNISDVYFTSTNEYETEYQKLRAKRKVSGLVDYDKED